MSTAPNPDNSNPGGTPPATPPAGGNWIDSFTGDAKGFIENKGWKSNADMLDSYRNLEKLRGVPAERLMELPEKEDDPAWGGIFERLGKPKEAKDYEMKLPDGADPQFSEWARGVFHESGLTKKQAANIVNKWNERIASASKAQGENLAIKAKADNESLKKEWGAAYDQNVELVNKAASTFGMDVAQIEALRSAMGTAGAMKFLHNIGNRLGEHNFVAPQGGGGGGFGKMSPEAARNEISRLRSDAGFTTKFLSGDKDAVEKMNHLHEMAMAGSQG